MSRVVHCRRYNKEMPGLERPPFPGPKGQDIFNNLSADAWQEWQDHQTRLINEKQLKMTDPEARRYISEQMEKFLNGEEFDQAEGYVPED